MTSYAKAAKFRRKAPGQKDNGTFASANHKIFDPAGARQTLESRGRGQAGSTPVKKREVVHSTEKPLPNFITAEMIQ